MNTIVHKLATALTILYLLADWTGIKGYAIVRFELSEAASVCFYKEDTKQTTMLYCHDFGAGPQAAIMPYGPPTDGAHMLVPGDNILAVAFLHENTDAKSAPILSRHYIPMLRSNSR